MGCSGPNLRFPCQNRFFWKNDLPNPNPTQLSSFPSHFQVSGDIWEGGDVTARYYVAVWSFGGGWNCDVAKISMKTFVTKKVMVYWKACQLLCLFQNVFRSRGYLERSSRHYSTLPGSAGSRRGDGIQMRLRSQWKTIVTTQVIAHWKTRHMLSSFPSIF